jgi:hypothetical protein
MSKVITARRADSCRECGGTIEAGSRINYGGPGAVSHEGCRPLQSVRSYGRRRVYGGYSATGRRCIDAPCCGCCD